NMNSIEYFDMYGVRREQNESDAGPRQKTMNQISIQQTLNMNMDFTLLDLGVSEYRSCLDRQKALVKEKIADPQAEDVLLFVEHPSVFTLGKRGGRHFFKISEKELEKRGVALVETERGGLVTYHGPGQLVAYPIFYLPGRKLSVQAWVEILEKVMIACAMDFGITAEAGGSARGVWVGNKKLGSVGVSLSHGVSSHGLALNVSTDLEPFSWISPCGMETSMTSLVQECGKPIPMDQAKEALLRAFIKYCPKLKS
ncbi:lipoyl(octanoyl) transferase LipB, partial [Desulfococcaceae bacterium OttesenSCG-928-F15]|nr:lipoyl(octanoyl) transferase LipB [Desulfococcaceae bacterium OttesenSCG-928-F15]